MNTNTLQFDGDVLVAVLHLREAARILDQKGVTPIATSIYQTINTLIVNYDLAESDIAEANDLTQKIVDHE